jgi:NOL1/NOP2/fmu family ribosome biogenesis protein
VDREWNHQPWVLYTKWTYTRTFCGISLWEIERKKTNCRVTFKADVTIDQKSRTAADAGGDNTIELNTEKDFRSFVQGNSAGKWSTENADWVYAHEAGHLLGLGDDYKDVNGVSVANPGKKGRMMASFNGKVHVDEVSDFLKNNNVHCPENCNPEQCE